MTVEEIIQKYLPEEKGRQVTVLRAMNYSVKAGGKRIRPRLMQEAYRLFGGEGEEVEPFMAAIEMIHTYSLVHDDLPAMDNDRLRRGRATTWAKYGEDMAILAGDALLTYAFETAAKAFALTRQSGRVGASLGLLARKAGIGGMVGGQTVDVENTGRPMEEEELTWICRRKTGALIEASLMIGAILGGADETGVRTMEKIGSCVGTAFQIRDDILDAAGTEEELGKPVGSDLRNEKTTWLTLYGPEKAQEKVGELTDEAVSALQGLQGLPGDCVPLRCLIEELAGRRS